MRVGGGWSHRHESAESGLGTLLAETDAVSLQRIDEAHGVGRPGGLGVTYAEQEFDQLGREQETSWPAQGERAARPARIQAAHTEPAATAAAFLLEQHQSEVREAADQHQHATRTLQPYVHRAPSDIWRYLITWVVLGLGDTAGVWGAAIWLGEVPSIALGQALACGFAAITAGLAGGELGNYRRAQTRQRDLESLSEDERRYWPLFAGSKTPPRLVAVVGGAIVVLVAVAIFALRTTTEGLMAGLTFGALGAATALGSFVSCYVHADDVADLLASYRKRHLSAMRRHRHLAGAHALAQMAAASVEAESVVREHELRGEAASLRVGALKFRMLRRNPQVVGHGVNTDLEAHGLIGRRNRLDGAA
jgi:uncharacterized membrane protein